MGKRAWWFGVLMCSWFSVTLAQESADSLPKALPLDTLIQESSILYVIPAGPIAGSFTEASRVQVMDTVAGWAKILVEGWVPVEKVLPRLTAESPVFQLAEPEKAKKAKAVRPQCIAKTSKGKQCSRPSMVGSKKCWQHSQ